MLEGTTEKDLIGTVDTLMGKLAIWVLILYSPLLKHEVYKPRYTYRR